MQIPDQDSALRRNLCWCQVRVSQIISDFPRYAQNMGSTHRSFRAMPCARVAFDGQRQQVDYLTTSQKAGLAMTPNIQPPKCWCHAICGAVCRTGS